MLQTERMDKSIRKYTAFDEMKADEYRYWQSRPAHERLDAVDEIIKTAYALKGWEIEPSEEDGLFRVVGPDVERLIARHDIENEDAMAHVEHRLQKMGILRALDEAGWEPGDDVEIAGIVFELDT